MTPDEKELDIQWWMSNRGKTRDEAEHEWENNYGLDSTGFLPCKKGREASVGYCGYFVFTTKQRGEL
jgi:hypothetical protein